MSLDMSSSWKLFNDHNLAAGATVADAAAAGGGSWVKDAHMMAMYPAYIVGAKTG